MKKFAEELDEEDADDFDEKIDEIFGDDEEEF